jgi:hypothetical protein
VLAVAGLGLIFLPRSAFDPDGLLVVGTALASAGAVSLRAGLGMRSLLVPAQARTDDEDDEVVRRAVQGLRRLLYQRSEAVGWSTAARLGGGSWLPVGADATSTGTTTDAELPLGVPQIVKDIVEIVGSRGRALVAIDELDKIESPERAREFINELKPVFTAANTFFLVSMSDDAIANFERRGLPFRDVFDSAFDEVIRVPYLSFDESRELINKRAVGVPPPFIALAHALSAGLPRDLLRTTRRMLARGGNIEDLTRDLVHQEIRGKTQAVRAAIRSVDLEPEASAVLRAINGLDACLPGGRQAQPCVLEDDWLRGVENLGPALKGTENGGGSDVADRRTLMRLGMELLGFLYYSRTLLELFVVSKPDAVERLERAIETDDEQTLDLLAAARQDFTVNPYVAWEAISRCRKRVGLTAFAAPSSLVPQSVVDVAATERRSTERSAATG